jgi:RNA polymerase sigma-70 factor (ECF subfamily)
VAADPDSDQDLLDRFVRGEAAAFERLYQRYRPFVMRIAQRFGSRDPDDALDVLQEAFAWLIQKAPTLRLEHRLSTLLYPVTRHLARDRRVRRERAPAELSRPEQVAAGAPPVAAGEDLEALLGGLSPLHREVVLLRFAEDLSLDEIAAALEVPLGTVKSRLHHAIQKLRARAGAIDRDFPAES